MMLTVEYKLGWRDILWYQFYHLVHSKRVYVIQAVLMLVLAYPVMSVFIKIAEHSDLTTKIFMIAVAMILIILICFSVGLFSLLAIVASTMLSKQNKLIFSSKRITANETHWVSEGEFGRSEIKWSAIQNLVKTKRAVLIYLQRTHAVLIPRRAFATAAEYNAFHEFCRAQMSLAKG